METRAVTQLGILVSFPATIPDILEGGDEKSNTIRREIVQVFSCFRSQKEDLYQKRCGARLRTRHSLSNHLNKVKEER